MSQLEAGRRLDERYAAGKISEDEYTRIRDRLRQAEAAATSSQPPGPGPAPSLTKPGFFESMRRGEIGRYKSQLAFFAFVLVVVVIGLNLIMPSPRPSETQAPARSTGGEARSVPVAPPQTPSPEQGLPEAELDRIVTALNKDGPQVISSELRFDSVTRMGRIFVYNYTELSRSYVMSTDYIASERLKSVRLWCGDPEYRRLLSSLTYVTINRKYINNVVFMTYRVSSTDCR